MPNGIQHVFVLMLENRSFDHLLGFSGITGTDALTGAPTQVHGLNPLALRPVVGAFGSKSLSDIVRRKGQNWPPSATISVRDVLASNMFNAQVYGVVLGADFAMPVDPGHEFPDVLNQLCGPGATYSGGPYPPIINSGFVASYEAAAASSDPGEIMKCYSVGSQLPVLNRLAEEFVVCDNWHASIPGPTVPNRFFVHAASSGGLDHSPNKAETIAWRVDGFDFPNGTIFDRMNESNVKWRIYAGDNFPLVGALSRIHITEINDYHDFAPDVARADYPASYTFVEPSYGDFLSGDFKCGTSQHPMDDVTRGESLIKATYEAIRNSPLWDSSLLIITWDEHGGFFDHVPPRSNDAIPPGDTVEHNLYGFDFTQYGVRVPAVVISPLIPRNLIDHRAYDHASIPATLEACFGLNPMTQRDANVNNLMPLISLSDPRSDAPTALGQPAQSNVGGCDPVSFDSRLAIVDSLGTEGVPVAQPNVSIDEGNLPAFLYVVFRSHLALSPPEQQPAIIARFNAIQTRGDASEYIAEVQPKVRVARNALSLTKNRSA